MKRDYGVSITLLLNKHGSVVSSLINYGGMMISHLEELEEGYLGTLCIIFTIWLVLKAFKNKSLNTCSGGQPRSRSMEGLSRAAPEALTGCRQTHRALREPQQGRRELI